MKNNLNDFDIAAAVILFSAIALVACGLFVFYVQPWVAYRRDRHRLPNRGEVWRAVTGGEEYRIYEVEGTLQAMCGGLAHYRGGLDDLSGWQAFVRERRIYCIKDRA